MGGKVESPFTVEIWDGERLSETIAVAQNMVVARAAYDAARGERPGRTVLLRHGTRVVDSSERRESAAPPTIGHLKSQGVTGMRLWCTGCGKSGVLSFEAMGAKDHQRFPTAGRRPTCSACGGHQVQRMPDWPRVMPRKGEPR
jgi:hypothetical protein